MRITKKCFVCGVFLENLGSAFRDHMKDAHLEIYQQQNMEEEYNADRNPKEVLIIRRLIHKSKKIAINTQREGYYS